MFRLAHISDVHLRPLPKASFKELLSKRIIGYLNWKLNRRKLLAGDYLGNLLADMAKKQPDHVAITGDLINISLRGEFEQAGDFLNQLGKPDKIFTICGNHDAYVPGSIKMAMKTWGKYMSGDDKPIGSTRDYPVLRIRDEVAIIACNSAEATAPFFATGYFRKSQATRLAQILEQTKDKCRVVMIHHPPFENATYHHKRLIGRDLFQKVIAEHGAELVLHGHTHKATRTTINGPKGDVPVICVPAAGHAKDVNDHPAGRYNLFSISKKGNLWSIEMEEYGQPNNSPAIGLIAKHKIA